MKPGTYVRLPDGREGTVVYHGLDGYGIRWGRNAVDIDAIYACNCIVTDRMPDGYQYAPEAMLRDPYRWAELPCVGDEYEVIE